MPPPARAAVATGPGVPEPAVAARSSWALIFHRLLHDPVAIASFVLLAVVVLGVFAGAPLAAHLLGHGPNDVFLHSVGDGLPAGPWTHVRNLDESYVHTDGTTLFVLGSDGYASDELPKLGGAAVDGMLVSTFFDYSKQDPAVQKFVTAFKAKYKGANPDWFAANSYDVIMLAAKAAENAGKNDRTAINDALGTIGTYPGISGPITFDANGDVQKPLSIVIVKDGALATAPQQPTQ